jgi:HEAT repeat protein
LGTGQRWGEGIARCFSIENDLDDDDTIRLLPVPELFICPMSQAVMEDPVMTVDGCLYERSYIEQWIRHRQQLRMHVTSPATNQPLPSHRLVSLTALKKAIEVYLAHRPELRDAMSAGRSFEEAAQLLQGDLLEKQAVCVGKEDEISLLRDSNEVLTRALQEAEKSCASLRDTHERASDTARMLNMVMLEKEGMIKTLTARVQYLEDQCYSLAAAAAAHNLPCNPPLPSRQGSVNNVPAQAQDLAAGSPGASVLVHPTAPKATASKQEGGSFCGLLLLAFVLAAIFPLWEQVKCLQLGFAATSADEVLLPMPSSLDSLAHLHTQWATAIRMEDLDLSQREIEPQDLSKYISQLRMGTSDQKTDAALVLGILATASPDNQAAIVRAGAVAPLVSLLRCNLSEARGQAAVALRAVASNNTYNKVAIVRAGAIPALIRLLQQDTAEVQEVAEGALQTLAETNNQVEIAQAGAVVPLVALLKDVRPGVREEAAGTLVILALNADNQAAIAQVGAIPVLVDLLQDDVAAVREQAAAALRNLAAENADNQAAIARAGAFAPLVELLKDEMPGVREEALAALRNLAGTIHSEKDELAVENAAAAAGLAIRASAAVASTAATSRTG